MEIVGLALQNRQEKAFALDRVNDPKMRRAIVALVEKMIVAELEARLHEVRASAHQSAP
jgi:hypothetical protein